MTGLRTTLGRIVGVILLLSGLAHSFLGAREMRAELAKTNAPPDLAQGLLVGWVFGGVAMLAFGFIVLWIFWQRPPGRAVPALPAFVIGGVYSVFGVGALKISNFEPFFLTFLIPGLLLLAAAWPARRSAVS